ncbi:MAG: cupin domain-containing protein [bacterium]
MQICKQQDRVWAPMMGDDVQLCGLRINEMEGGAALISMKKGARFPSHSHRSDEQTLILSGVATIGGQHLSEGDYLFTPEGETHDIVADEDVLMYVTVENGVEMTEGNE